MKKESANLTLESFAIDDPCLPPPPSGKDPSKKPSISELTHLKETKAFGGLVPEQHAPQQWQCSHCGAIHPSPEAAKACHESAAANRVQICRDCGKRLTNCTCKKRFP
jgi:hypothetical protein